MRKKIIISAIVVIIGFTAALLYNKSTNDSFLEELTYEMNTTEKYEYTDEIFIAKGYDVSYLSDRYEENQKVMQDFMAKINAGKPAAYNMVYKTDKNKLAFIHLFFDGKAYTFIDDTTLHTGYDSRLIRSRCLLFEAPFLKSCDGPQQSYYFGGKLTM